MEEILFNNNIDFESLESKLLNGDFIKNASNDVGYDYKLLKAYVVTSLEEAKHTLKLINKYDLKNKKILEFGSGLGISSMVLSLNGCNITSFEPGGIGFEKNALLNQYLKKYFSLHFNSLDNLADIRSDTYDFIFSNNVLEHIDNIEKTILHLDLSLKKNGIMCHNLPNYIVPYEPHFGILFFPIFPKKMSFLVSKEITKTGLWRSINFINVFDIKSYSRKANSKVTFEKRLIYKAIKRIDEDQEFADRHSNLRKLISLFRKIGFLHLIKLMPASLNTPMVFEWKKNDK